jgi:hypothetical protein
MAGAWSAGEDAGSAAQRFLAELGRPVGWMPGG